MAEAISFELFLSFPFFFFTWLRTNILARGVATIVALSGAFLAPGTMLAARLKWPIKHETRRPRVASVCTQPRHKHSLSREKPRVLSSLSFSFSLLENRPFSRDCSAAGGSFFCVNAIPGPLFISSRVSSRPYARTLCIVRRFSNK